jgi:hypothetical protein
VTDESKLAKVRVVYQVKQNWTSPAGKLYKYLIWHGYYREGGRRHRVYIGRELPERLRCFIREKRFIRSQVQYYWPESRRRVKKDELGADQVSGR